MNHIQKTLYDFLPLKSLIAFSKKSYLRIRFFFHSLRVFFYKNILCYLGWPSGSRGLITFSSINPHEEGQAAKAGSKKIKQEDASKGEDGNEYDYCIIIEKLPGITFKF